MDLKVAQESRLSAVALGLYLLRKKLNLRRVLETLYGAFERCSRVRL